MSDRIPDLGETDSRRIVAALERLAPALERLALVAEGRYGRPVPFTLTQESEERLARAVSTGSTSRSRRSSDG